MKMLTLGLIATFMMFLYNPGKSIADNEKTMTSSSTNPITIVQSSEFNSTDIELSEIKAIDLSALNSSETKELVIITNVP